MMEYKEINITDIENIKIGNAQDEKAGTGLTVVICEKGAPTGLAVMGGGPASRDSNTTEPKSTTEAVHAVVLAGGSAFGLNAAGGVMDYLEKKNVGYECGVTKVPIVVQSDIFDLGCGECHVRPDEKMAIEACKDAEKPGPKVIKGNMGVGTGATIGKAKGIDYYMKGGIGTYAVQIGKFKVGAIVVVNCFGDVYDYDTGKKLGGVLDDSKQAIGDCEQLLCDMFTKEANLFVGNTTLACVVTNAKFDKVKMNKIASMAHNGYARTISPVNTTADGDSVYAMSVGDVEGNIDMIGTVASMVVGKAIGEAIKNSEGAYGFPGYKDIKHD